MKILCKLSHFLNLFFIACPLLGTGPVVTCEERVDLKNLAQNTSHSSRFATSSGDGGGGHERVLPFRHDFSAVVVDAKDKSQPQPHRSRKHQLEFDDFEGFGSSSRRRSSQTGRTALNQSRDTVRTKDRKANRHETLFSFDGDDDGTAGKDPKSENNQAEMKVFHPRRASGGLTTGKDESVSDATADDVVDAAKEDDYYDTVAAGVDDNYEDEKIIKPASSSSGGATLDSFFDGSKSRTSARAFENRNGASKAVDDGLKNGASIHGVHGDRDEQDSTADADVDGAAEDG